MERNNHLFNNALGKKPFHLAIVGGGRACRFFLELMKDESLLNLDIRVVGVCDINPMAEGFRYAKEAGIYTTESFKDLLVLENLGFLNLKSAFCILKFKIAGRITRLVSIIFASIIAARITLGRSVLREKI